MNARSFELERLTDTSAEGRPDLFRWKCRKRWNNPWILHSYVLTSRLNVSSFNEWITSVFWNGINQQSSRDGHDHRAGNPPQSLTAEISAMFFGHGQAARIQQRYGCIKKDEPNDLNDQQHWKDRRIACIIFVLALQPENGQVHHSTQTCQQDQNPSVTSSLVCHEAGNKRTEDGKTWDAYVDDGQLFERNDLCRDKDEIRILQCPNWINKNNIMKIT